MRGNNDFSTQDGDEENAESNDTLNDILEEGKNLMHKECFRCA